MNSSVAELQVEVVRLREELKAKEETIRKLNDGITRRDNRKKNAEKLLEAVEKRNKELIEELVRREKDIAEGKKKVAEAGSDLQRARDEVGTQVELCRKRDEQIQALIAQLKRRDTDLARTAKELQRKAIENQELQTRLSSSVQTTEGEIRGRLLRELEQAKGLAAAKDGEVRLVKEMVKSYHAQLRQKDVEMQQIRMKAVKLPPIDTQKTITGGQASARNKGKAAWRSPRNEEGLDDVLKRSQKAVSTVKKSEGRQKRATQSLDISNEVWKKDVEIDTKGDEKRENAPDGSMKASVLTSEYDSQGELALVELRPETTLFHAESEVKPQTPSQPRQHSESSASEAEEKDREKLPSHVSSLSRSKKKPVKSRHSEDSLDSSHSEGSRRLEESPKGSDRSIKSRDSVKSHEQAESRQSPAVIEKPVSSKSSRSSKSKKSSESSDA